jgi:hypothetical protein
MLQLNRADQFTTRKINLMVSKSGKQSLGIEKEKKKGKLYQKKNGHHEEIN